MVILWRDTLRLKSLARRWTVNAPLYDDGRKRARSYTALLDTGSTELDGFDYLSVIKVCSAWVVVHSLDWFKTFRRRQ